MHGRAVLVAEILGVYGEESLTPGGLIGSAGLVPPRAITFDNYREGWNGIGGVGFGRFFLNSFVVSGLAVLGNVISCSMAAYAFARINFKWRRVWFAMAIGSILLPAQVLIIPQYVLFRSFGWINTYYPLIVPKFLAHDAFFIFLMVQFIRGIPKELDQAARIDGCGHFGIYTRIILPLTVPGSRLHRLLHSSLGPSRGTATANAHQKDAVENYLHDQVCRGTMQLADAQRAIATDWLAV